MREVGTAKVLLRFDEHDCQGKVAMVKGGKLMERIYLLLA